MTRLLTTLLSLLMVIPFVYGARGSRAITRPHRYDLVAESGDSLRVGRATRYTSDGVTVLATGQSPDSALRLFGRALEVDSTYAPAHFSMVRLLQENFPDSALYHARKAYQLDTTNHWYLDSYARCAILLDDYVLAQPLYEKLLKMVPNDINAYRILAIIYNHINQPQRAIMLIDTAEMRVGRNIYLTALKQMLLTTTGQTERAIKEAQVAVEDLPYEPSLRVNLAELYSKSGRDSLAMSQYNEAMKLDSVSFQTLISYSGFLYGRGEIDKYLEVLSIIVSLDDPVISAGGKSQLIREVTANEALYRKYQVEITMLIAKLVAKYPNNINIVNLQAHNFIAIGEVEDAINVYKNQLAQEPPIGSYYASVISLERHLNRTDSLYRYLHEATERMPEAIEFRLDLAYTLAFDRRYDEAVEVIDEGLKLPNVTDSIRIIYYSTKGDYYQMLARRDSSIINKKALKSCFKCYDKALAYDPDNISVLNNYAYFISIYMNDSHKKLELARAMSMHTTSIESSNPTYLDTYAWVLYQLGEYEEAKMIMRQAFSLDISNNYEIALHYGEILMVLGETTMANYYWGKAKELGASDEELAESRQEAEKRIANGQDKR